MRVKRTQEIHVRVTPDEKARMLESANRAGLDLATWVRTVALSNTRNPYVIHRVGALEVK